jgi:hypothetical protein
MCSQESMAMAKEPLTIIVDPESDLGRALAEAVDMPIILEREGKRFQVIRANDDLWTGYDPQRVRRALRQSAGALNGVDTATLKRELREQRSQNSTGRPA